MPLIKSSIDTTSNDFKANDAAMAALIDDLRRITSEVQRGGGDAARERHQGRGKLLVRDRIDALLDPGSPFLELSPLAAYGVYEEDVASAGIVTGIGRIEGRECVVVANDATVKGGTYFPLTVKKHIRAQEIGRANGLPCIYLVDSGGANLPKQNECIFRHRIGDGCWSSQRHDQSNVFIGVAIFFRIHVCIPTVCLG